MKNKIVDDDDDDDKDDRLYSSLICQNAINIFILCFPTNFPTFLTFFPS